MKKGFIVTFIIAIVVASLSFLIPFLRERQDVLSLKNKVSYVNKLMTNDASVSKVTKIVQDKVKTSSVRKIDSSIIKYLNELISRYQEIEKISNSNEFRNLFLTRYIKKDKAFLEQGISLMQKQQEELNKLTQEMNGLLQSKTKNSYASSDIMQSYKSVLSILNEKAIQNYLKTTGVELENRSKGIILYQFLFNHFDNWDISDDTIIFLKRSVYEEYGQLDKNDIINNMKSQLVDDHMGPNIIAQDITIYLNQTISLEEKIQCIDDVDDTTICNINGSYDNQKVGDYPISISSVDKSSNQSEKTIIVHVKKRVNSKPYSIDVIRNQNVVIVYGLDENDEYTKVVQVFTCSTGRNNATPTGTFSTIKGATWGSLYGGVWGQYTTRIVGDILFHSVPYFSQNKGDLEWEEYNKLGTQASLGCVRLSVRDAKWIFYNCPSGTIVKIYDGDLPNGVSKPGTIHIDGGNVNKGWDPTDDDSANPWNA